MFYFIIRTHLRIRDQTFEDSPAHDQPVRSFFLGIISDPCFDCGDLMFKLSTLLTTILDLCFGLMDLPDTGIESGSERFLIRYEKVIE